MIIQPNKQVKLKKERRLGTQIQEWAALLIAFVSVFVFFLKILFF